MKMKNIYRNLLASAGALAAVLSINSAASALDEITVAYFLEWPTPNQYGQHHGTYDKALGVKVNWRAFDTGTAMSAAMASGDVHIAFSQGLPPFVVATSAGQDLQVVDIAVSYSDNDNCVVRSDLGITKANASELEGKQAGVPIGTAAHYGFLKQMEHFGVDVASMKVVDMAPADGAAAFANGSLDMVCGWGGALRRMKEHGNVLLTGAEKEELGIKVIDLTTVPSAFAAEYPDIVEAFVKETARLNAEYTGGKADEMIADIAKEAGMDIEGTKATLAGFSFPTVAEQNSKKWFGGGMQTFLKEVADFFVAQGNIPSARASYDSAVNGAFLKAAQ